jgi:hypothetical protein
MSVAKGEGGPHATERAVLCSSFFWRSRSSSAAEEKGPARLRKQAVITRSPSSGPEDRGAGSDT